jgi:hypothetical protein
MVIELSLVWIGLFGFISLILLIRLFNIENDLKKERNRALYSEERLVEIVGYVNLLSDDQWQKHAVKRYLATKSLERGVIKSITEVYPIKNELSIKQGQNTLLIGAAEQGKTSRIKEWIAKNNLQQVFSSNVDDLPQGDFVIDVLSFIGSKAMTDDEKALNEVVKVIDKICNDNKRHLFIVIEEFWLYEKNHKFMEIVKKWLEEQSSNMTFIFSAQTLHDALKVEPYCKQTYCFRCNESYFPIEINSLKKGEMLNCEYLFASSHFIHEK